MAANDRSEQGSQAYKQAPDSGSPSSVTYFDLPVRSLLYTTLAPRRSQGSA